MTKNILALFVIVSIFGQSVLAATYRPPADQVVSDEDKALDEKILKFLLESMEREETVWERTRRWASEHKITVAVLAVAVATGAFIWANRDRHRGPAAFVGAGMVLPRAGYGGGPAGGDDAAGGGDGRFSLSPASLAAAAALARFESPEAKAARVAQQERERARKETIDAARKRRAAEEARKFAERERRLADWEDGQRQEAESAAAKRESAYAALKDLLESMRLKISELQEANADRSTLIEIVNDALEKLWAQPRKRILLWKIEAIILRLKPNSSLKDAFNDLLEVLRLEIDKLKVELEREIADVYFARGLDPLPPSQPATPPEHTPGWPTAAAAAAAGPDEQ